MSGVQSWAISVCFTVIAASILQYISCLLYTSAEMRERDEKAFL